MTEDTEYTLKINGKMLTINDKGAPLVFDKHEDAVSYRLDWIFWSPHDTVQIMHRRVVRHHWFLTTNA